MNKTNSRVVSKRQCHQQSSGNLILSASKPRIMGDSCGPQRFRFLRHFERGFSFGGDFSGLAASRRGPPSRYQAVTPPRVTPRIHQPLFVPTCAAIINSDVFVVSAPSGTAPTADAPSDRTNRTHRPNISSEQPAAMQRLNRPELQRFLWKTGGIASAAENLRRRGFDTCVIKQ